VTYRRLASLHPILAGLVLSCLLAACRSNAPETSTPQPAPAATPSPASNTAAPTGRPVIVAFGDSLTAGFGADPGDSYPDYLEKDLNTMGYHYQVINQGISGNTTKDGVDRLQDALSV
jgi:acyl-CoA thioesterase I